MDLTKLDLTVLKALVSKELEEVKEQGENFKIVNSPVLSSISRTKETDLQFLATEAKYVEFLEELERKL